MLNGIGFAVALALSAAGITQVEAQSPTNAATDQEQAARAADTAFWRAFNDCDAPAMARLFASDVEFYHDMTGLTRSRDAVTASMMKGPCGTPRQHMRREAIAASVLYQRIPDYGALIAGEHLFYVRQGQGPEKAATRARFLTIWQSTAKGWLMTRIVSYDHQPVPYKPAYASIAVPLEVLKRYVGRYDTASGVIDVSLADGALVARSGNLRVTLAASADGHFFALERDLRFTFSGDADSMKIAVEENGATVAAGTRSKVR